MADIYAQAGEGFAAAVAAGDSWDRATEDCLAALGAVPAGANLGFVYTTDSLAGDFPSVLERLKEKTGVPTWVGTTGFGVAANATEIHDRPAVSILVGAFPEQGFHVFDAITEDLDGFRAGCGPWLARSLPLFGVVHGDPRNPLLPDLIARLSEETSTFLVGGLSATRGVAVQVAEDLTEGGLSGVLFGTGLQIAAGLSQGCTPIGPTRMITAAERNVVMTIDQRPAVEVLREDVERHAAPEAGSLAGNLMVAFPVPGSDTGDYLVRNLMGVDPQRGWLAVGELVEPGRAMTFCRRDREAAETDLKRMLSEIKGRLTSPPRAGLYFSCVARGQNLFGPGSAEMQLIRDELGDLPLTGFYANGEISNNRLYGYTGVLALFL